MKIHIKLSFLSVICLLLISCVNGRTSYKYEDRKLSYKGRDIIISVPSPQQDAGKLLDYSVLNLLDENPETVWSPFLNCRTKIQFTFSEPVYIMDITVLNGFTNADSQYNRNNRAKTVVISTHKDEKIYDPIFGAKFSYMLSDVPSPQTISFMNRKLSSVLRIKTLSFEVVDCYEVSAAAKIGLRGISINFGSGPLFKPTMTVEEIKTKFVADEKDWYIISSPKYNNYELVNEIMANLIYEGLKGNESAETLLYNYNPPGAMSGEVHSYLIEWYELTKKYKESP